MTGPEKETLSVLQPYALTRKEKKALERLAEAHRKYPGNDIGFHPNTIGKSNAAACRRMEHKGFVTIRRQAENCFRYTLSAEGKERERQNGGEI